MNKCIHCGIEVIGPEHKCTEEGLKKKIKDCKYHIEELIKLSSQFVFSSPIIVNAKRSIGVECDDYNPYYNHEDECCGDCDFCDLERCEEGYY